MSEEVMENEGAPAIEKEVAAQNAEAATSDTKEVGATGEDAGAAADTVTGGQTSAANAGDVTDAPTHETLKADAHKLIKDAEAAGIDIFNLVGMALTDIKNAM